jgi:ABC-type dipeptide/oligopeptide/nickel transport system permease subunit
MDLITVGCIALAFGLMVGYAFGHLAGYDRAAKKYSRHYWD